MATLSRRARLISTPLLVFGLALGGCGQDVTPATPPCTDPAQISLPVCAPAGDRFSDEACTVFDDAIAARSSVQDARAATVTAPTESQRLPRAMPFTFVWTAPTASRRRLPTPRAMTLADEFARWTTLLPSAEAHCEPFSGRAYELRFRVSGATILRRQQSATTWTPNTRDWGVLVAGGGGHTIEITVYTALFNNGQIGATAGPFTPMAVRSFVLE